jgi:16S rRNA (uracil1498-N3)-methyltransferase
MKIGDELLLCDGEGTEYAVKITRLDRAEIRTEIMGRSTRTAGLPRVTLGQGLPKSDKMDFIVQKATELGVAAIVPLTTERTIMKIKDEEKRSVRWRKIAREAAMQSNRPDIPHIEQVRSFRDFIDSLPLETATLVPDLAVPGSRTLRLLPWEEGTDPIRNVLRRSPHAQDIIVLIGPEGGFSQAEADTAKEKGFHLVSLGPNILRSETAAIASLSMIGYEFSTS